MRHYPAKLQCGDAEVDDKRGACAAKLRTHLLQELGDMAVEIGVGYVELRHDVGGLASERHIRDRSGGGRNGRKGVGIRTGINVFD